MAKFDTSWFPQRKYTRKGCHPDWMFGPTKFPAVVDLLNVKNKVKKYDTVFWNRTLNAAVSLYSYREAVATRDPKKMSILKELQLPDDITL